MGENGEIITIERQILSEENIAELQQAIDDGNHQKLVEILLRKEINLRSYWHDQKVINKILTDAVNGNEVVKKESRIYGLDFPLGKINLVV